MNKILKLKGLVIKKIDYGEADRILKILTEEFGKIDVIIKGIRKSSKRDRFATDILVITEFVLNQNQNRIIAKSFSTVNPFIKIRMNFFKMNISYYILSILNQITVEDSITKKISRLTFKSFDYINKENDENKILILLAYYFFKLIKFEGLSFNIKEGKVFDIEKGIISSKRGQYDILLNEYEKKYLILLNSVDIEGINELKSSKNGHYEVIKILEKYVNYHLTTNLDITRLIGRNYLDEFS